jgi:hypothetical protein
MIPQNGEPLIDASLEALAVAAGSTLTILLYVLIVSNVYPQDVLRTEYEAQCSKLAFFESGAIVLQNQARLKDYLRHATQSLEMEPRFLHALIHIDPVLC